MKTPIRKTATAFLFVVALTCSLAVARQSEDKVVVKARAAVENAAPDDWMTFAKSAEKCLNKKANLKEVNEWLEKSIEIKATPYNLSLKGDYYVVNNLPDKALEYYVKAMSTAKAEDVNADVSDIQSKIAKITNIGG